MSDETKNLPFDDASIFPYNRDPLPRLGMVIEFANEGKCEQPPPFEGEARNKAAALFSLLNWLLMRGWRINDPSLFAGDGLSHPNHEFWMDSASQYHLSGQIINAVDRELYNLLNEIETKTKDKRYSPLH